MADDIERLIARLDSPEPPALAPEWPAEPVSANSPSRWRMWVGLVAAAAGVALAVIPATSDRIGTRGSVHAPTTVTLSLDRVREGQSARLISGDVALVGDAVYFALAATPPGDLTVWVEGPTGVEDIGNTRAVPEGAPLTTSDGHIAYVFDAPGAYTFHAGAAGGSLADVLVDVQ